MSMASGILDYAQTILGEENAAQSVAAYSPALYNGDEIAAFAQFNGDYYIRCPAREFASFVATSNEGSTGNNVYLYNFAHFANTDPVVKFGFDQYVDTTHWASHMAEIPFVFGTLDVWDPNDDTLPITADDYALSIELQTRWAAFAKTGDPNVPEFDGWEEVVLGDNYHSSDSGDGGANTIMAVMVFEAGTSEMQSLPEKAYQCSTFPYARAGDALSPSAAPSVAPTTSSGGQRNLEGSIIGLFVCVVVTWFELG
jgi:hypothetical protein